jgi:hypothetical protein
MLCIIPYILVREEVQRRMHVAETVKVFVFVVFLLPVCNRSRVVMPGSYPAACSRRPDAQSLHETSSSAQESLQPVI